MKPSRTKTAPPRRTNGAATHVPPALVQAALAEIPKTKRKRAEARLAATLPVDVGSVPPPPPTEPAHEVQAPRAYPLKGPESRGDGSVYLAREDLLLIELRQSKTMAALQAIALRRNATEKMIQRHEQERHSAHVEALALVEHGKAEEAKVAVMWTELQAVYGLDFTQVSYDDETGKIIVHETNKETIQNG